MLLPAATIKLMMSIYSHTRSGALYTINLLTHLVLLLICISHASAHERHPLQPMILDWKPANISRALVYHADNQAAASVFHSFGGYGSVLTRAGRQCVRSAFVSLDVDDAFAFDIDETVTITLTIDTRDTPALQVVYDHAIEPMPAVTADLPAEPAQSQFAQVSIELPRARFAGRGIEGTDIVIASPGSSVLAGSFFADPESNKVTICDVQLQRSSKQKRKSAIQSGKLTVRIVDDTSGSKIPARVGIYDEKGRHILPGDDAMRIERYGSMVKVLPLLPGQEGWAEHASRYAFYSNGLYRDSLAEGDYEIVVARGPEYRIAHQEFEINAGRQTDLVIRLKRWQDLAQKGWYSGDAHIHMTRARADNQRLSLLMQAEDLRVANLLQMAKLDAYYYDQFAFGDEGQYVDKDYALAAGQESPRTGHRGHSMTLNGQRYYEPSPFYSFHKVANAARADGGLFGYAHVAHSAHNVARSIALDLPFDLVDFLEVLQYSTIGTAELYDTWNLGIKTQPVAGSDYPYINNAGHERNYVYLGEKVPFSPAAYFEALQQGQTFVSNGPIIEFTVNDQMMGSEISLSRGDKISVSSGVQVNPDFGQMELIELVKNGEVIASQEAERTCGISLDHEMEAEHGMWLAVRAQGSNNRVAHSAPVYVSVDGDKFWDPAKVAEITQRMKSLINELVYTPPLTRQEYEVGPHALAYGLRMMTEWRTSEAELKARAEKAHRFYDELANAATAEIKARAQQTE